MTEESKRRLVLAQRMAAVYATKPNVVGVLVTGSVARGEADENSDIDMSIYYSELPTEEELKETRPAIGGSEYVMFFGAREDGGWVESYYLDGIRHDLAHTSLADMDKYLDEVLVEHKADSQMQKIISGIEIAIPLHGADYIGSLKQRIRPYPEGLAESMVRHHMRFRPYWVPKRLAADRDDTLLLYELLIEQQHAILGTLMGLNRIYHWGEYKRMDSFLARLEITPPNLSARLKEVLKGDIDRVIPILDDLIEETFMLVEQHMPQIDVAEKRRKYRRPFGE